jgi:glutamine amidotransferase
MNVLKNANDVLRRKSMCELMAMTANVPTDICFSFSGLMERGGNTGPHKDGWGITFYEGKGCRSFKDPQPSCQSPIAKLVKDYPIKSQLVICHIRQANSGPVSLENTHPFSRPMWGKNWTYAHNGQLDDFLLQLPVKTELPVGSTDSEHAFCYILEQLHDTFLDQEPDYQTLFRFIAKICERIRQLGVFNVVMSNGDYLFAFCSNNLHSITRRAPFGKARLIDTEMLVDFKNETSKTDVVTVIATQPLTNNEQWFKMSPGQWQLFYLGERKLFEYQDDFSNE